MLLLIRMLFAGLLFLSLQLRSHGQVCSTVSVQLPSSHVTGLCGIDPTAQIQQLNNLNSQLVAENKKLKEAVTKLEKQVADLTKVAADLKCTSKSQTELTKQLTEFKDVFYVNGKYRAPRCRPYNPPYKPPPGGIFRDCWDAFVAGKRATGVQTIQPMGFRAAVGAFCDQGWTYIQRREDNSQDFNQYWSKYESGFGYVSSKNHWVGSDFIHFMTRQKEYTLRAEMIGWSGKQYWAEYSSFSIGSEADDYRLNITGYTGNYKDGFSGLNGVKFSTRDRDNDHSRYTNCAAKYGGGWWLKDCGWSLNRELCNHASRCSNYIDRYVQRTVLKVIPTSVLQPQGAK